MHARPPEPLVPLVLTNQLVLLREPKGGLRACVERCGLQFVGRAHSGLVDSRNTAKIVLQMLQQGFRFERTTRGFAPDGTAWGSKKAKVQPGA